MLKKFKPPARPEGEKIFSKAAGAPSGVPQPTVQQWTDKGYILSPTDGTGDRREYTVFNCIEIGVVRSLAATRLPSKHISKVMKALRGWPGTPLTLEEALGGGEAELIIRFYAKGADEYIGVSCVTSIHYGPRKARVSKDGILEDPEGRSFEDYWRDTTIPKDQKHVKTLVVDLKYIERKVVKGLG